MLTAARIFRPSRPDRITDRSIERAHSVRTAAGAVATAWVIYAYPLQEPASEFARDKAAEVFIGTAILLVTGSIALGAFVLAARRPARSLYRRRSAGPLTGLASLLSCVVLTWLLVLKDGMRWLAQGLGAFDVVVYILGVIFCLFATVFVAAGSVLCLHHLFRTADVHEVLPPLISPVLAWTMFALQVLDASPVAAPAWVQVAFLLTPPLSVTALSIWELRRLRTHFGVTVRRALHRERVLTG
ncbi:hypothetical protein [Streptomyces nanshensis]|uniref:Uncharacterized protein n=1 Tax=Streptomyces nanshensis TaxID=518642 RepID=A0A1E7KZ92_9ACTN|nr:hypothetical protein [Streptomyces nanshensis]OEV09267.1 hypothetical protein AN218_22705 [Streptomyces nanshensis]